jgi:diaminopropionate ammonia-lyase
VLVSDVGGSGPARWVIDGYATLFAEAATQARYDLILVPVGVGSLAAAAARHGARAGVPVVGVEPVTAACLTASLRAGEPTRVPTPGTTMAGLDCAEVSAAAWPSLRAGIHATVTVTDEETDRAVRDLRRAGLRIGESGAAPLAALSVLAADRHPILRSSGRVLLIATEGPTGTVA